MSMNFKRAEIVASEADIIVKSAMYLIPEPDQKFRMVVVDDEGNKRYLAGTGLDGRSAYEVAVQNGYVGTVTEWLNSLKGEGGPVGASAYEIALANGFSGTEDEWLESIRGSQGPQGPPGANGQTPTIGVGSVTSLPTNQTPTVTNTGTSSGAIFNFGIPKGETGLQGPQGAQGPQGIQGLIGAKGDKGDKGDTGNAGPAGTNAQSFNYRGDVDTYSGLPPTASQNDAYYNKTDKLFYIYNGTSFPQDGNGLPIGAIDTAQSFDEQNITKALTGKVTAEYINTNKLSTKTDYPVTAWVNGYGGINGNIIQINVNYKVIFAEVSKDVVSMKLSLKTRNSDVDVRTVYGQLQTGGYEVIYDAIGVTLTDFVIPIEKNRYKFIYINALTTSPTNVIFTKELISDKFAKGLDFKNTQNKVNILTSALDFFASDEKEDIITSFGTGAVNAAGNVVPVSGYIYIDVNPQNAYKIKISGKAPSPDIQTFVLGGRKQDNTVEFIYFTFGRTIVDLEFEIEPGKYKNIYFNTQNDPSVVKSLKLYTKLNTTNSVKTYIDSNSGGGSGPSIQLGETFILAENFGVKSTNTGSQNLNILNTLSENNKGLGGTIILPRGNIKISDTFQLYNTLSLKGAVRGSADGSAGTTLQGLGGTSVLNIKRFNTNDTAQSLMDMRIIGSGIVPKCVTLPEGQAFFEVNNVQLAGATDVLIETVGCLIYIMRNMRLTNAPNGLRLLRTNAFQANHIRFEMIQFAELSNIATYVSGGGQVVFEQCDWEQNGTAGNLNTGNMVIENMSPLNEGVDVTLNNCWSEYVNGGFWMKINNSNGVTTLRDTMLWKLNFDAQKGIINNGSKLLITGSTRINDFSTNIETINNGQTRVDGFPSIGTHTELTGGTYKVASYS